LPEHITQDSKVRTLDFVTREYIQLHLSLFLDSKIVTEDGIEVKNYFRGCHSIVLHKDTSKYQASN